MTKYIDADSLRAEIKFAKSVYDNPKRVVYGVADACRQDGRAAMCDDVCRGCWLRDRFGKCHWTKGQHCKLTDKE